jgi:hypothetical protein
MTSVRVREWLGAVRRRSGARLARILWIVLAVVVWNVIFDRVLVLAGRRYVYAAAIADRTGRPYERIDDWMRPAVTHGLLVATGAAGLLLVAGLVAIRLAETRQGRR